jgi:hypothetical protein
VLIIVIDVCCFDQRLLVTKVVLQNKILIEKRCYSKGLCTDIAQIDSYLCGEREHVGKSTFCCPNFHIQSMRGWGKDRLHVRRSIFEHDVDLLIT